MPHRPSTFRYRVYNGLLLLAVAVVMGTSLMSLRATSELQASVERASTSQQVLEQIHHFWGLLGDSESHGLRFLITGNAQYLTEFRHTVREMDAALDQLQVLTVDYPPQFARVGELRRLHRERADYGRTTQELRLEEVGGDTAAGLEVDARIRSGRGARFLIEMKETRDALVRAENARLAERNASRNQMIQQNWATVLVANCLALVAGLVGYSSTRRLQRRAQEAYRAELQAEQARRSSHDKSVFLASMSHEIRTPMNAIFGFANLLADSVTDPTQAEHVAAIRKSGQALLSLINDVLDLSKMEAGKLELREEPTDLREIVDQILTMFRQSATVRGIDLRAEYEGPVERPLLVDPVRLRQVLINLVSNAVKYTERGSVTVRISCAPSTRGEDHCDLRAEVVDTGTGIAPHQLGVIFEPFEQGDSPDGKAREGTGLGLSIARRLAALMGGSLTAESTLGVGSRFVLEAPGRRCRDDVVTQQPVSGPEVDFDRLPPLDVLVVDDVAWNRDLVAAYLRDTHHRVRQADDGATAVDEVQRNRPDVVLMDLRMPRMSGEQALLRIKSDPDSAQVPVIAVTASSMSTDENWLRNRFDGYVRKPFSRADLFTALAAHFEAKPAPAADGEPEPAAPLSPVPGRVDAKALAALRGLYSDEVPALRSHLRMREAGALAETFSRLAAALEWPRLDAHGRALAAAVEAFDVPAIRKLLDDCPMPEVPADE